MQEEHKEVDSSQHRWAVLCISAKEVNVNNYQANIEHQIRTVQDELRRLKDFVNVNGYDCTTALFTIVQSYRLDLKRHLNNLVVNLQDLTEDRRHQPIGACMSDAELKDALGLS